MSRHLLRLLWHRRGENALVAVEILVSFLVLFAVLTLGTQALVNASRPLGFDWRDRWDVGLQPPAGPTREQQLATLRQVMLALREFPEVQGVAVVDPAPFTDSARTSDYRRDGRAVRFRAALASDDYAAVAGIEVVRGRWFSREDDGASWTPAVVTQAFVDEVFPGEDPLGRNIASDTDREGQPVTPQRIVGVVREYRQDGESMWPVPYVFTRARLDGAGHERRVPDHLALRMAPGTGAGLEERIGRRVEQAAPGWSVRLRAQEDMRAEKNRYALAPLAMVGLVAAFLMMMVFLGLSGVLWQAVTRRTREIGLRRAKGATARDVQAQILAEIALLTTVSVALGAGLVLQLPLLDLLGGVPPGVFAASLALAIGAIYVLTLACGLYPSRLATRLQPAEALHYE